MRLIRCVGCDLPVGLAATKDEAGELMAEHDCPGREEAAA